MGLLGQPPAFFATLGLALLCDRTFLRETLCMSTHPEREPLPDQSADTTKVLWVNHESYWGYLQEQRCQRQHHQNSPQPR